MQTFLQVALGIVAVMVPLLVGADRFVNLESEDTFIIRNADTLPQGESDVLITGGLSADGLNDCETLIKFPNLAIPEGGSLVSATLALFIGVDNRADDHFRAHRLLADWSDSDTYSTVFGGDGIQADGMTDAESEISFTIPVVESAPVRFDVTDDVAYWLENPDKNFGWGITVAMPAAFTFGSASAENEDFPATPRLLIRTDLPLSDEEKKMKIRVSTIDDRECFGLSDEDILSMKEASKVKVCRKRCRKRKLICTGFKYEEETSTCTLYKGNFVLDRLTEVAGSTCGLISYHSFPSM